jgi:CBS domain containing-hemolysin-like protein
VTSTAMSDTDTPRHNEPVGATGERINLPVPLPRPSEVADEGGIGWFARLLRTFLGWKTNSIRADLEVVLETGAAAESGFSPEERAMLKNILGLRERGVEDVMVPRADIVAVQKDISLGELVKVFEVVAHSRLVVYDDTLDDPTGMVHIRDLIGYMANRAAASASTKARRKKPFTAGLDLNAIDLSVPLSSTRLVRTILFVPPSMPAIDLLAKMQATRIHLALVIDEYGGTDGLVSIEDIVEQIVGDIEDEHDEDATVGVVRQQDGSYLANARASLDDVTATIGAEFDVGEAAQDVDTLGGYLVTRVGRVPVRGELVPGPSGFEIEVLDADPRRVKRVRIYRGRDRSGRRALKRRDERPEGEAPQPAPPSEPGSERSEARPASDGGSS